MFTMTKHREHVMLVILLLTLIFGPLLPSSFPFSHLKVVLCLITIFVLPGYLVLALIDKQLRRASDPFEKSILALAISFAFLIVPWIQVFLLHLDLRIALATILGFDMALVTVLLAVRRHMPIQTVSDLNGPTTKALLVFIATFVILAYLLGGNVFGDGYSYMTWLRNMYVGDVSPQDNIHAAWESTYPFFKNIFAPLLMGYAICAKMARVDPNIVWSIAPAFITFFFFGVNYSLTYLLFKKRAAAGIAVLITPMVLGNNPSVLGDSHGFAIYVLAPLTAYVALRYILLPSETRLDHLVLVLVGLLGFVLAAEHLQNLIYVLYSIGAFSVFTLGWDITRRRVGKTFKRSLLVLIFIVVFAFPYILWTWLGVQAAHFDVAYTLDQELAHGGSFIDFSTDLIIVHPRVVVSGYTTYWVGFVVLASVLLIGKRCYRTPGGRFVCSNTLIVLCLGLNPLLVSMMAKLMTAQFVNRIGEMLPVVPVLSFTLLRTYLTGLAWYKTKGWHRRLSRLAHPRYAAFFVVLILIGLSLARHAAHMSLSAINLKVVHVVYGPEGANPNWLDHLVRHRIVVELEDPPFPILEHPTTLNRVLDSQVIHFIESTISADSMFLTSQLPEFSLPAYTDQLVFVGRRGWPLGRDVCQDVVSGELKLRRTTEAERLVADRLETVCTVLDPQTDAATIERLLDNYADAIDYVLVTPVTGYLKVKLQSIEGVRLLYDRDGFTIFEVRDTLTQRH